MKKIQFFYFKEARLFILLELKKKRLLNTSAV